MLADGTIIYCKPIIRYKTLQFWFQFYCCILLKVLYIHKNTPKTLVLKVQNFCMLYNDHNEKHSKQMNHK